MKENRLLKAWKLAGLVLTGGWFIISVLAFNIRKSYKVEKEYIPFKIKSRKSRFVQKGWAVWMKEGKKGYRNTVKETFFFGNKNFKQNEIYKTGVLKEPEHASVIKGISEKKHPITVPEKTYVHYVLNVEATAYDPSPESNSLNWAGITSLGWRTRYGIAAVDPKVIALRSLIYVDGYGFAWTGDTGGDIKGRRIDLCYNTTEEALKWGRKKVKVYVLGKRPLSYYRSKKQKNSIQGIPGKGGIQSRH